MSSSPNARPCRFRLPTLYTFSLFTAKVGPGESFEGYKAQVGTMTVERDEAWREDRS